MRIKKRRLNHEHFQNQGTKLEKGLTQSDIKLSLKQGTKAMERLRKRNLIDLKHHKQKDCKKLR